MQCPECHASLTGLTCACGYQASQPAAVWVVGYCATDGCGVRIRYRVGHPGSPICQWCQRGEQLATTWGKL